MNFRPVSSIAILALCLSEGLLGQPSQDFCLDAVEKLELHNLKAEVVGLPSQDPIAWVPSRLIRAAARFTWPWDVVIIEPGLAHKNQPDFRLDGGNKWTEFPMAVSWVA
jgi:hypothetical protein